MTRHKTLLSVAERVALVDVYDALARGSPGRALLLEEHGLSRTQLANWRSRHGRNACACGQPRALSSHRCPTCQVYWVKVTKIKQRFGITLAEAEELASRDTCEACGAALAGPAPHIDHDHSTGLIRGVLCRGCNFAAGHLHDSPEAAEGLARYLRSHLAGYQNRR